MTPTNEGPYPFDADALALFDPSQIDAFVGGRVQSAAKALPVIVRLEYLLDGGIDREGWCPPFAGRIHSESPTSNTST